MACGGRVLRCRRDALIQYVITAEGSLPASEIAAAVDAVATSPAVLRDLAAALAADRDMLRHGAPPVAGRLAGELIARGSATLTPPACARCGRAGVPLYPDAGRGHVQAVRGTPAHSCLRALRRGQARCQPRCRRRADLRTVPPP